ncbi:MAG: FkbM family methyltransferase [Bdellovibrionota bacterium]
MYPSQAITNQRLRKFSAKCWRAVQRRSSIAACPHLRLGHRLRLALSLRPNTCAAVKSIVDDSREEELSVRFAGFEFRAPCPSDLAGKQTSLEHFSQVIAETFIAPLHFLGPVRISAGDIVFDLGGNIGTTAALFSQLTGSMGKVYAFEPCVPETLLKNSSLNRLGNLEVFPLAVSDSCGLARMSVGHSGMDSTLGQPLGWHSEAKEVATTTLDHFIREQKIQRVDFVKMDIEGAEENALRGAEELIRRFRPKWSISSYHNDFSGEKQHPKLMALLKSYEYTVEEIPGFHIFAY